MRPLHEIRATIRLMKSNKREVFLLKRKQEEVIKRWNRRVEILLQELAEHTDEQGAAIDNDKDMVWALFIGGDRLTVFNKFPRKLYEL